MTHFKRVLRQRWERFWFLVDSESILVNQMLFYVFISLGGLYNIAAADVPVQVMEWSTSGGFYSFWLWMCFLGPLATIIGKACKHTWAYAGLWLQLAGDTATWLIFVTYVTATVDSAFWGKGLFAGFLVLACLMGTPIFIARDIRRLRDVEAKLREGTSDSADVVYVHPGR